MKGRVYDSALGIFLTADPIISRPTSGRTYGAYAYVLNNPTTFTDPDGFETVCGAESCVEDPTPDQLETLPKCSS